MRSNINRHHHQINETTCAAYPSQVNITNVLFQNFTGYTSGKYGRAVARLTCSPNAVCENIKLQDFRVASPCGGDPVVLCDGLTEDIGVPCVGAASPEGKAALKATCATGMAALPEPTPW